MNATACPGESQLAAYVDGRLSAAERAEIQRHLADCDDCREVVAEAVRLRRESGGGRVLPFWRRRSVQSVGGGLLALAAALILVVRVWPDLNPFREPDPFEAFVAAVGTNRTVEARLTGGFAHGPRPSTRSRGSAPREAGEGDYRVLTAAAGVQTAARENPTPEHLHALGLTHLVLGRLDEAIEALEEAIIERVDARLLSDLAGAYLERGSRQERPEDFARALDAAERAVRADPNLLEARFNLALALEAVHLTERAETEWERLIRDESSAAWRAEAEMRLRRLRSAPEVGWMQRKPDALKAFESGQASIVSELAATYPERVRDLLEDEVLPAWGEAWLHRNAERASRLLRGCEAAAATLVRQTGDTMPASSCSTLMRVSANAQVAIDPFAHALVAFGEARKRYEANQIVAAVRDFQRLEAVFLRFDSPLHHWCDFYQAVGEYYGAKHDAARLRLQQLSRVARRNAYSRLAARTAWMQGLLAIAGNRFDIARRHYQVAADLYSKAGERVGAAVVSSLLSEASANLGDANEAWRYQLRALGERGVPPQRRHTILIGSAVRASRQRLSAAAWRFADAAVRHASEGRLDEAVVEARLHRSRAASRLKDPTATDDVRATRVVLPRVGDVRLRSVLQAELDRTIAEAAHDFSLPEAEIAATQAIDFFSRSGSVLRLPALYLTRAAIKRAADKEQGARDDLLRGIEVVEQAHARMEPADTARISYAGEVWPLYTEMARRATAHQGADTLTFLERGRHMLYGSRRSIGAIRAPAGVVVLAYVAFDNELVTWIVNGDVASVRRHRLSRERLAQLVRHLTESVARDRPDFLEHAATIHDLLIPSDIDGESPLVVVPDETLAAVPFPALWNQRTGRFLIESRPVVIAPGVTFLQAATPVAVRSSLVLSPGLVGGTEGLRALAGARAEARGVAEVLPGASWLDGSEATRDAFMHRAPAVDIVHFAGHAVANPEYPRLSRLVLGHHDAPGDLFAYEIAAMDFSRTQLVVLAACGTAAGRARRGEAVTGLASAFVAAGTRTVVATLWDIRDDDAANWFSHFTRRIAGGERPAAAYRATTLHIMREPSAGDRRPSRWAGVTLITTSIERLSTS